MKFGQNLQRYSVPQWALNNVDYDNVKTLIKVATTSKPVQAISIPGVLSQDVTPQDPEQDVWLALSEEMDRLELFCRVKHGETQRRLEHQHKLMEKNSSRNLKLSAKRLKTLSRIEDGIIEAGNQLRMLSRFIGANRLAFVKLLKKFEKWGGSVQLCERFRRQRLESSPWLNARKDPLSKLLLEYTILLESVRAPFDTFQYETQAEFDAVFASSSSSRNANRATYWIHQDNVIQAHILMQSISNQTRLSPADTPSSPKNSPLRTFGNEWTGSGMIVSGQLDSYKSGDKGKTAVVHYTSADKLVILTLPDHQLSIKRKDVPLLLQTEYALPNEADTAAFNTARHYMNEFQEIKPIVEIGYSRTRLAGVENRKAKGIWATLDNSIMIGKPGCNDNVKSFPHAVLDIRWEGDTVPDIVKKLDDTGIAERIPNFDITAHAIAVVYPDSVQPEWMQVLQNELRKPSVVEENIRGLRVTTKNNSNTSTSDVPVSPFSAAQAQSSATSTYDVSELADNFQASRRENRKKKLRSHRADPPDDTIQSRYWNEFDDGDEDMQAAEPYAIEVYPDNEDIMVSMFKALVRRVRKITGGKKSAEQKPLLTPSTGRSSVSSEATIPQVTRPRTYSTFANQDAIRPETPPVERALLGRERILFHATWVAYALAASFLIMSIVIEGIGRKRYSTESRVFSVFAILMSFLMGLLGLMCMSLTQRLSIVGKSIVVTSFGIVCVADALLTLNVWQNTV